MVDKHIDQDILFIIANAGNTGEDKPHHGDQGKILYPVNGFPCNVTIYDLKKVHSDTADQRRHGKYGHGQRKLVQKLVNFSQHILVATLYDLSGGSPP